MTSVFRLGRTSLYHEFVDVPTVVIMAAGRGTRMRSRKAKVLHPLCGRPLLLWPIEAAREAGATRIVVVLSRDSEDVQRVLPPEVEVAVQTEQAGTADAVLSAREQIAASEHVIVLSGDHPLLEADFISALAQVHLDSGAAVTVTTRELDDPAQYGRIVRTPEGDIDRIVETKADGDATPEERAIREVNLGTYAFAAQPLLDALGRVQADNAQGELYLGDVLPLLRERGGKVAAYMAKDDSAGLGINTRADLAMVQSICRQRILERHMLAGVTITDPASTVVEADVRIGEDTVIEPYTFLRGRVEIGASCRVGPVTTLTDCVLGSEVSVVHSYLEGCEVLDGCSVGPFAYLRPGTTLHERAKAGSFVEVKNSDIGEGTKIPHLSYIGDADVGARTNIGAGNITANYDGREKHRTVIGSNVHTGVDTAFVAPVVVGDDAYTAAGSVITDDVPEGALGVARARQQNIEGYAGEVEGDDASSRKDGKAREAPEKTGSKGESSDE
jgi:bifunctional UDP-N-acetylglucosamine pyrophosphorylase / glucosamine-1-phosphate N-acetyltransferase